MAVLGTLPCGSFTGSPGYGSVRPMPISPKKRMITLKKPCRGALEHRAR